MNLGGVSAYSVLIYICIYLLFLEADCIVIIILDLNFISGIWFTKSGLLKLNEDTVDIPGADANIH